MSEKILKLFIEKGFLLDRDTLDFFRQIQDEDVANEIISKIEISGQKLVTKNYCKRLKKIIVFIFLVYCIKMKKQIVN